MQPFFLISSTLGKYFLHFSLYSLKLTLLFILSLTIQAQEKKNPEKTPTIAMVLSLSGPHQRYGREILRGMQIALTRAKETTDVNYVKNIKLIIYDDHSSIEKVKEILPQIQATTSLIVGAIDPIISAKIASYAVKNKIAHIIPCSPILSAASWKDYVFMGSWRNKWQGVLLAHYTHEVLKAKKIAVLFDPTKPLSHDLSQLYINYLDKMKIRTEKLTYNGTWQSKLKNIIAFAPEVLLFPESDGIEVKKLINSLKNHNIKIQLLGLNSWSSMEINSQEFYYVKYFSSHLKTKAVVSFVDAFKKTSNNRLPSSVAAMGYDVFMTILSIYKAIAQDNKIVSFRDGLLKGTCIPGLLGNRYMNIRERYLQGSGVVIKKFNEQHSYTLVAPVM
jgi:ABC-type branched-subunit amino acid transport system substrate-binding protein